MTNKKRKIEIEIEIEVVRTNFLKLSKRCVMDVVKRRKTAEFFFKRI